MQDAVTDGGEKAMNVKSNQQIQKEAFDFSSDSDDNNGETMRNNNKTSATAENSKQFTLQQCGLLALLQKAPKKQVNSKLGETSKSSDGKANKALNIQDCLRSSDQNHGVNGNISSDSGEESDSTIQSKAKFPKAIGAVVEANNSSDESDNIVFPTQVHKSRTTKSEKSNSPYLKNSIQQATDSSNDCISDESDDIPIPSKSNFSNLKHEHRTKDTERNSQTIEAFSSSDDDQLQSKKMCIIKQEQTLKAKKVRKHYKWTSFKKNEDRHVTENKVQKETMGTLDQILGNYLTVLLKLFVLSPTYLTLNYIYCSASAVLRDLM